MNDEVKPEVMAALIAQDKADAACKAAGIPTYRELVAQLTKVNARASRVTHTDSGGWGMVSLRVQLIEETRKLVDRIPR